VTDRLEAELIVVNSNHLSFENEEAIQKPAALSARALDYSNFPLGKSFSALYLPDVSASHQTFIV